MKLMKNARHKAILLFLFTATMIAFPVMAVSCQFEDSVIKYKSDTALIERNKPSDLNSESATGTEKTPNENEEINIDYFDYKNIKIENTYSIGVKIKNCNLVLDYFGDLILFGEIENLSSWNKTSMVVTFDFYDKKGEVLFKDKMPMNINYLRISSKMPFCYVIKDKNKYIDIGRIKIGINYKDYYKLLEGNAVAKKEKFYYKDDILHIDGKVINIGESKICNLTLLATFYDKKDMVVFIKKCYLSKQELLAKEQEDFNLEVLLSRYAPEFTHYDFEVFFEDSVKMP